jgi:GNAT superfamily N-acetyltransferase
MTPANLRNANPSELNFIFHWWAKKSWRPASIEKGKWSSDAFRELMAQTLERKGTRARVAVDPQDDDKALGFAITEKDGSKLLLHMVYVKDDYRRQKIASRLIQDARYLHGDPKTTVLTSTSAQWIARRAHDEGWGVARSYLLLLTCSTLMQRKRTNGTGPTNNLRPREPNDALPVGPVDDRPIKAAVG